jgi:hypothetical protein
VTPRHPDTDRLAAIVRAADPDCFTQSGIVAARLLAAGLRLPAEPEAPDPYCYRAFGGTHCVTHNVEFPIDAAKCPASVPVAVTPGLSEAWAEAEGVVFWDWTLRLTRLVKGGYRAEAVTGDEVKAYGVASDPDAALRELTDVITESHVND